MFFSSASVFQHFSWLYLTFAGRLIPRPMLLPPNLPFPTSCENHAAFAVPACATRSSGELRSEQIIRQHGYA